MAYVIAVSGKGGTGKTTISALILRELLEEGKKPVLMIDADADGNLSEALGLEDGKTVGEMVEELQRKISDFPPGFSKDDWLEAKIAEVMLEERGFDLLVMGRGEGPGCYCYVNSVLRKIMDTVFKNYPYVVMDNAAGMEHLSRRTTREADAFLVISDHSMKGIQSATRIASLARELDLEIGRMGLIVNRAPGGEVAPKLVEEVQRGGLELIGTVPEDEEVMEFDMERRSLLELPDENRSVQAVKEIMGKIQQRR